MSNELNHCCGCEAENTALGCYHTGGPYYCAYHKALLSELNCVNCGHPDEKHDGLEHCRRDDCGCRAFQ